jgi:hypothetical protein
MSIGKSFYKNSLRNRFNLFVCVYPALALDQVKNFMRSADQVYLVDHPEFKEWLYYNSGNFDTGAFITLFANFTGRMLLDLLENKEGAFASFVNDNRYKIDQVLLGVSGLSTSGLIIAHENGLVSTFAGSQEPADILAGIMGVVLSTIVSAAELKKNKKYYEIPKNIS